MIDYHTYCEIHSLHYQTGWSLSGIAEKLRLDPRTVSKWVRRERYEPRKLTKRPSNLDPYKDIIRRELELDQCSASSVFRQIRNQGYEGGRTTVIEYVATLPRRAPGIDQIELPFRWMHRIVQGGAMRDAQSGPSEPRCLLASRSHPKAHYLSPRLKPKQHPLRLWPTWR